MIMVKLGHQFKLRCDSWLVCADPKLQLAVMEKKFSADPDLLGNLSEPPCCCLPSLLATGSITSRDFCFCWLAGRSLGPDTGLVDPDRVIILGTMNKAYV